MTFFLRRSFRCLASLATVVVLPAPCRPAIRIDRRRRHVEVEVAGLRAHHRGQLVAHDLDQRLAGRQRLQHFLADRAHLDALDQRLHHRQRDVGFQQRDAHLAGRFADVLLGQAAAAAQAGDGAGEALGEGFEHGRFDSDDRGKRARIIAGASSIPSQRQGWMRHCRA